MSQERVYQALRQAGEAYLSGQQLSAQLGITRAAVWKAVEGLRRQGCVIEAKAGAGYRLRQGCDRLTAQIVAAALSAPRDRWQVLAEVDSTNSACRRLALEGAPDGTVVMADCQTAGRGRRAAAFNPPGGWACFCLSCGGRSVRRRRCCRLRRLARWRCAGPLSRSPASVLRSSGPTIWCCRGASWRASSRSWRWKAKAAW